MENASKALIIVASVLIGIMLLSFMVYVFSQFSHTARSTDERLAERDIEAFNAKFDGYSTIQLNDEMEVDTVRKTVGGEFKRDYVSIYELFKRNPSYNENNEDYDTMTECVRYNYPQALIEASQSLNTVSDVVTAINDAIDVNDRNNNGYLYSDKGVETKNSVEIIVDLGNDHKINGFRYLVIEPSKFVKAKYVYGFNFTPSSKETNINTLTQFYNEDGLNGKAIKVYSLLEEFRETKNFDYENRTYTVYKYYFIGEKNINPDTGLIDSVRFTLVEDENFDRPV